ncbi:MAG: response regulator [Candidatus Omnitrophica bacterium]|nr:response regulator [Candidatus Omnitrophota bacterium]
MEMDRKKIMIVDDDHEFLDELNDLLEASGYEVVEVTDNSKVVATAAAEKPAIIVIDLKMSPKTGFQLSEEIRKTPPIEDTPIIAMSAYFTREEDRLLRQICGINTQVNKPFNPLDIIAAIERELDGEKEG